ncbi:MAG: DNA translocase FtsK 4TM domain-containing protein, partial [Rhodospirillaceae bacterium]|nr:DNA translocase FtsK 4TM domain-containing protein [Rhodospirillaceae bacterium]
MAWIAQKLALGPLLPAGVRAFIVNRLWEAVALAFAGVALAYGLALWSYAPGDPSFNSATDGAALNWLGRPGAALSDLMIQSFGLAAWAPVVAVLAWSFSFVRKRAVTHLWFRVVLLLSAMLLLSICASIIKPFAGWPLATGLGGFSGVVLLERLTAFVQSLGAPEAFFNTLTLAAALAIPGLMAMVFSLGLPTSDWRAQAKAVMWINRKFGSYILLGAQRIPMPGSETHEDGEETRTSIVRARRTEGTAGKARMPLRAKKKNLIAPTAPQVKTGRKAAAERQPKLDLSPGQEYKAPPLDLLDVPDPSRSANAPSAEALEQNAAMLSGVLEDFGIHGEIVKVRPGPVITLYELEPAPGTKSSRVIGLSHDIARSMSAVSVRVATVPGRNVIGIELPNQAREMVHLRELLASVDFEKSKGALTLALGKDIGGVPVNVDLARMPHLLIAGTTGSGKSVGLNAMILSLLYQHSPEQCRFIMIDPKMLELSVYDDIPHLLSPVVTDPSKAVVALKWAVREMEERYRAMSQLGVRNI